MTDNTSVVSVTLVFENCEKLFFKPVAIGQFLMNGFHTDIGRFSANAVLKCAFVDNLFLELYLDKGVCFDFFDSHNVQADIGLLRNRLMYNDIARIILTYEDDHTETYCVKYDEGENTGLLGAPNVLQDTYLNQNVAYICISKDHKRVSDFVDLDAIECQRINDGHFHFSLGMLDPSLGSSAVKEKSAIDETADSSDFNQKSDDAFNHKLTNMAIVAGLQEQLAGTQKMLRLVEDLIK